MEVAVPPEELAAVVAEVRKTEKRFGARRVGEGVYRVVVQVYAWFRHANTAVQIMPATGYRDVL